jgi:hypothetical protein
MSSFSSAAPLGFFTLTQKKDASSSSIRNDKNDGKTKRKELTWESAVKLAHVLRHEYSSMSTNHGKQVATTLKKSYRLQSPDQGVASILHVMVAVAKKNKDRPPISSSDIVAALHSGRILIPQIQDKDGGGAGQNKKTSKEESSTPSSLPDNWQLLFIYQQLIDYFHHEDHQVGNAACQSCIKALQLVQMLSPEEEAHYFAATDRAFRHWQLKGNEPLEQHNEAPKDKNKKKLRKSKKSKNLQTDDAVDSTASGCSSVSFIEIIDELLTPTPNKSVAAKPKQKQQQTQPKANETNGDDNDDDNADEDDDDASAWSVESFIDSIDELITPVPDPSDKFEHGMILFTDGNNNTHHFQPNFLPPYGYGAKRQIILDVICTNQDGRKIKAVRPLTVPKSSTRSKNGTKQPPTMIQCDNQPERHPPKQTTTRQHSYSSEDDDSKQKQEQSAAAVTSDPSANNNSNRDLRQKFTKLFQKRTASDTAN